ncbi:MAG TPA: type VI secretion system tip protein TssI/VgrG, partial [Acidobacteriaceae bacterium]
KDMLLVDGFVGREAISSLTELSLDLLSAPDSPVSPSSLIGKRVTLGITVNDSGTQRYFNGIVRSLALVSGDTEFLVYKAEVVPSLWLLTLNKQTRAFQSQKVLDIVKAVLSPYSITPQDNTQGTYQTLDYCTQYRETDYDFVMRLLEQHGIFYFFTHTENDHTLVLGDTSAQLPPSDVQSSFRYMPETDERAGFYDMYIQSFATRSALITGQTSFWEYRFTAYASGGTIGSISDSKQPTGDNAHQVYDYADAPSAYTKTPDNDNNVFDFVAQLQDVTRDRTDTQSTVVDGQSNASLLLTGATFTLTAHPDAAQNAKYLVLSLEHKARQQPPFRSDGAHQGDPYSNRFSAQPSSVPYRPPMVTPRPRVNGVVTGKVVVPSGEESYLDKYGRVAVQFWWDRNKTDAPTTAILRVAQSSASAGWGSFFWPRVNDEVLIDFIDGDPDAPIVVGSLYNSANLPKYDPPSDYTRSGVVTRSSKQGSASTANELSFEDLKGSEEFHMHAEKDLNINVENNRQVFIGNEQHITVNKDQFETLKGNTNRKITKDCMDEIDGDLHVAVKGAETRHTTGKKDEAIDGDSSLAVSGAANISLSQACNEKIGTTYSLQVGQNSFNKTGMLHVVDAGQELHLKGGMMTVLEGGQGVCISGPGGFITITEAGIMIQGIIVMINSGGAQLPGSPGMPESPQAPGSPKSPTDATLPPRHDIQ